MRRFSALQDEGGTSLEYAILLALVIVGGGVILLLSL
jgi:hypothetical protein